MINIYIIITLFKKDKNKIIKLQNNLYIQKSDSIFSF